MNLKAIQRNYARLTMMERLSLADQALARNDESEIKAIIAASPRKTYSEPDYIELFEVINHARFCNLIVRLNYVMMFFVMLHCADDDADEIPAEVLMAAYLYVRATDSWRAVCEEFGLCPDFGREISSHLYAIEMLEMKDGLLREFAFTEEEAQAHIEKSTGGKIQTLADEIKAMREVLGLPRG